LITAGYPRARLVRIANAAPIGPRPTKQARRDARHSLAQAHPLLAMSEDAPIAVYTGRLHPLKGLDNLIEAWSVVAARRPDARLWIVGDGPERAALWRQIADAGLDGRVVLAGSFDTVDEFLAAADLFVLPSLEEGMSMSLLEAMAAGLPVVASDIPGNRAIVQHEVEGLLTPPRDPDSLAMAIERILADREQADRLAAGARARVEREFAMPRMVEAHRELFDRLIADHRSTKSD
jgi:glycosyltransferase involved in cell wall biosynthesis